jgi:hypothetical protein
MRKQKIGFVLMLWAILIAVIEVGLNIGEFVVPLILGGIGTIMIVLNSSNGDK